MFPDAVTERGRKHIAELAAMHDDGYHTGVLFLVHWDRARWFLPDYHTDTDFAATFMECAPKLDWKAFPAVDGGVSQPEPVRLLSYPEEVLRRENHDCGDYMLVMYLPEGRDIEVGAKGSISFLQGYYVYVGSAKKNLASRLARHTRKRKKMHWHIDYLRRYAGVTAVLPVRTATTWSTSWPRRRGDFPLADTGLRLHRLQLSVSFVRLSRQSHPPPRFHAARRGLPHEPPGVPNRAVKAVFKFFVTILLRIYPFKIYLWYNKDVI